MSNFFALSTTSMLETTMNMQFFIMIIDDEKLGKNFDDVINCVNGIIKCV